MIISILNGAIISHQTYLGGHQLKCKTPSFHSVTSLLPRRLGHLAFSPGWRAVALEALGGGRSWISAKDFEGLCHSESFKKNDDFALLRKNHRDSESFLRGLKQKNHCHGKSLPQLTCQIHGITRLVWKCSLKQSLGWKGMKPRRTCYTPNPAQTIRSDVATAQQYMFGFSKHGGATATKKFFFSRHLPVIGFWQVSMQRSHQKQKSTGTHPLWFLDSSPTPSESFGFLCMCFLGQALVSIPFRYVTSSWGFWWVLCFFDNNYPLVI